MKDRILAIISESNEFDDNLQDIVNKMNNIFNSKIVLFTTNDKPISIIETIKIPSDFDTLSKRRNFVNKYFLEKQFKGFVHIVSENTLINQDKIGIFVKDIENMMSKLKYPVWFSTICDPCNYVYKKYNPRVRLIMDDPVAVENGLTNLVITSHSNLQYVIYDFENIKEDLLKFDESYSIAMYIIIEFLARRRNTKTDNQLFYMNQYFTVESEYQAFKEISSHKDNSIDANKMKEEDQIFKSRNIIFNPDNNIDKMLEDLYTILNG
jgi:hypothetical protein